MKLLYVYTNPSKQFDKVATRLVKLQIDNDFELGWAADNIHLYSNFEYEYRGVKARLVPDIYDDFDPTSNKVPVILRLLKNKLLDDDLYWYHDLDVYQLIPFEPPDVKSLGIARYAYKHDWQCGSFFFRTKTEHFFDVWNKEIKDVVKWSHYAKSRTDEKALKSLVLRQILIVEELNHSYNFCHKFSHRTYPTADKPIKAVHFRPDHNGLDEFMYGNNKFGIPYITPRLTNVFHRHGFR